MELGYRPCGAKQTNALLHVVSRLLEFAGEESGASAYVVECASPVVEEVAIAAAPAHKKRNGSNRPVLPGGPCANCGINESPQWRRPSGKKMVLCNACGIYYSRHHTLPKKKKMMAANQAVIASAPHLAPQQATKEHFFLASAQDSQGDTPMDSSMDPGSCEDDTTTAPLHHMALLQHACAVASQDPDCVCPQLPSHLSHVSSASERRSLQSNASDWTSQRSSPSRSSQDDKVEDTFTPRPPTIPSAHTLPASAFLQPAAAQHSHKHNSSSLHPDNSNPPTATTALPHPQQAVAVTSVPSRKRPLASRSSFSAAPTGLPATNHATNKAPKLGVPVTGGPLPGLPAVVSAPPAVAAQAQLPPLQQQQPQQQRHEWGVPAGVPSHPHAPTDAPSQAALLQQLQLQQQLHHLHALHAAQQQQAAAAAAAHAALTRLAAGALPPPHPHPQHAQHTQHAQHGGGLLPQLLAQHTLLQQPLLPPSTTPSAAAPASFPAPPNLPPFPLNISSIANTTHTNPTTTISTSSSVPCQWGLGGAPAPSVLGTHGVFSAGLHACTSSAATTGAGSRGSEPPRPAAAAAGAKTKPPVWGVPPQPPVAAVAVTQPGAGVAQTANNQTSNQTAGAQSGAGRGKRSSGAGSAGPACVTVIGGSLCSPLQQQQQQEQQQQHVGEAFEPAAEEPAAKRRVVTEHAPSTIMCPGSQRSASSDLADHKDSSVRAGEAGCTQPGLLVRQLSDN